MTFCESAASNEQDQIVPFATSPRDLYRRASEFVPPAAADVAIIENDDSYVFDEQGIATHSRHLVYKVLTQKGAEGWAEVSLSWEPWDEEQATLRARVITPDNAEHPLDPKTITDAPAKETDENVYSDRRVMRAPLPALAPGSVVEEEETLREKPPFPGAGLVVRYNFGPSVPVQHARLVLDAPSSAPLRYQLQLLPDLKPQRTESGGRVRMAFEFGPIDAVDDVDSQLPSDVPAYPNVSFSTGETWSRIAEEYSKIVDEKIGGGDLKSLVEKVGAGKGSRETKAAAILQFVSREIRYTGVEFGEATVVPRPPQETLARRYGDCKDKAVLLVALFRAAGIPAYVALLNAGNRQDISAELPGMGMLDHAIVYAPGAPDLWIDVTDDYARLGQLPVADQDRFAVVARPDSKGLVRTPVTSSTDNTLTEKRDIYLTENGPARIVETSQPHGSIESGFRRSYADKESKQAKEELTKYMKFQYLAEKLDRFDRSDPHDLSKQFELILESARAKRGATDLSIAVAAIRSDTLFGRLPSELQEREKEEDSKGDAEPTRKTKKKRTADYQLDQAFVTEWQYTIYPPAGFRPKPLPKDTKISIGPAVLSESFSAEASGVVHALIRFDTVKRRLSVPEATELRNKVAQLKEGEPILIYFEPVGQALLSEGKVREAFQSYRALIKLHPKEAVHHLQLAGAFLAAGLGEAAREEARTAVNLEPTSALAEKTLADILEYDAVGRKFRPGSDYAEAEAAFRAAEKLDPSDKATIANLAILLEFNQWGLHYGPGAKLKQAVAEYRKLKDEDLTELGVRNNLAFALFYSGEFSEARAYAEGLNPQPSALIVACEAALNGSPAALAEAKRRVAGDEQFKQVAKAAGLMLVNLRRYSLAADLEEVGASGNDASETAAYASLYRKTQPHEQLPYPNDPVGVSLRLIVLEADPNLTVERLRSIASRNGQTLLATQEVFEQMARDARTTLSGKAREGSFPDVGLDLSLTRAQPKVQGEDASGYKVTLWPSANYKRSVYVIKEDGQYRVLGTSRYPYGVGLEVFGRIASGDLAGARTLLDWVRDDWHVAGGDDPLAGAAFPRLWTKGRNADARAVNVAAASLLVQSREAGAQGVRVLEGAKTSPASEAEESNIALALLEGYNSLEKYDKALAVTSDLMTEYPESRRMFLNRTYDLRSSGRFNEAEELAQDRLKRISGDLDARRVLVWVAADRGEYSKAHALEQKVIEEGNSEASDLNEAAWLSLYADKVDASDIESALKAAELSQKAPNVLHTLGCVYAEVGKGKEAREVLVQAMDSLNLDEPDDNYLYAFGRIAEQAGERDMAARYYNRVKKPKRPLEIPTSSYRLAQLRLQALGGGSK